GPAQAVRSSDDVGDHPDEPEVEDAQQEQPDKPALAHELGGIEQRADPGHEADDHAGQEDEPTDKSEPKRGPREEAATDGDDVGAVHDEPAVGDGDPDPGNGHDGAGDDGDRAADEESADSCLGHDALLLECCFDGGLRHATSAKGLSCSMTPSRMW